MEPGLKENVPPISSNVRTKTRTRYCPSMTLTRREKNAFPAITDAMEGKIFSLFPSYQENDFLKYFYSRHDCQDGSDENDCDFSNIKVNKKFM